MSGGSAGNLSALAVARDRRGPPWWAAARAVAVADTVHSSVENALALLGVGSSYRRAPTGSSPPRPYAPPSRTTPGRVRGRGVGRLDQRRRDRRPGRPGRGRRRERLWLHVDGAYGLAGLLAPSVRQRFVGIERADSFIVDPHKWLFGPLDCCALVYRDPEQARAVHTQHAPYLDALHVDDAWNPADLAFHLTRRTRGLPVWFSLAAHGVAAYRPAVDAGLDLARAAAERVHALGPPVELVIEPTLSVVLFRRAAGPRPTGTPGRAGCSRTAWPS